MAGSRVLLTEGEVAAARRCAEKRIADAGRVKAKDRMGSDSIESHFWGALGEIAFAKRIDRLWTCRSMQWSGPDVGRYEVRSVKPGTEPYVKAKANDPSDLPISLVLFNSEQSAVVVGWITAGRIRDIGVRDDPGGVGAPAWFVRDVRVLDPVFPEISAPWGQTGSLAATGKEFPLRKNEDGTIEVVPKTCSTCGASYLIEREHLLSPGHLGAVDTPQTEAFTIDDAVEYKFKSKPTGIAFGDMVVCPRCRGVKRPERKRTTKKGVKVYEADEMCMDPHDRSFLCKRCGGWGVVPNVGPTPVTVIE